MEFHYGDWEGDDEVWSSDQSENRTSEWQSVGSERGDDVDTPGSGLVSLEYWDYNTIEELECLGGNNVPALNGDSDDRLLVKKNKELEEIVRWQQVALQDQALKIEFLSKQTTGLRDVHESRTKLYEQLEQTVTSLEQNNKLLEDELAGDKSKIYILRENVIVLEQKCEDLQISSDNMKKATQMDTVEEELGERREVVELSRGEQSKQQIQANREKKALLAREIKTEMELVRLQEVVDEFEMEQLESRKRIIELEEQVEELFNENLRLLDEGKEKKQVVSMDQELQILLTKRDHSESFDSIDNDDLIEADDGLQTQIHCIGGNGYLEEHKEDFNNFPGENEFEYEDESYEETEELPKRKYLLDNRANTETLANSDYRQIFSDLFSLLQSANY